MEVPMILISITLHRSTFFNRSEIHYFFPVQFDGADYIVVYVKEDIYNL